MKSCILLSGQLRNAKNSFESIKKNLIDTYDADVFISTWSNSNKIQKSNLAGGSVDDDSTIDEIINLYNPITIEVDKYEDELVEKFHRMIQPFKSKAPFETKPLSVFMMWYKIMKVNQLKSRYEQTNGFKYDTVIRSRFDLNIDSQIEIIDAQPNELYIPKGWDWKMGYNDLFALGNSQSMDYYCDMFNNLLPMLDSGHILHPEYLMKVYLDLSGFKINRPKMDVSLRGIKVYSKEAIY